MDQIQQLKGNVRVLGPGYARGPVWEARTVREADDPNEFKEGAILVALDGDYDFSFAISRAVAALVEQNDLEGKVVKLCRENKIPCIVGLEGLMDWITRYDYLDINSRTGIVKKIRPSLFGATSTYIKREVKSEEENSDDNDDITDNKLAETPNKPKSIWDIISGRKN